MSSDATLDGLLRRFIHEAVADLGEEFRRDVKRILTEELAGVGRLRENGDAEYVTVKKAAKLAGVHDSTIRGWIKSGKLRAYQPEPRILRVRVDELHAVMAGSRDETGAEVIDLDAHMDALRARASRFNSKE